MEEKTRVGMTELAAGALRIIPRLPTANKGLALLPLIRSGQRRSIGRMVEKWARKRPGAIALRDAGGELTYRDLSGSANRIGHLLQQEGVRKGDAVAVLMHNRKELVVAATGALKFGGVAGLLNYNQQGDVLAHSLALIEPRALIVGTECREAFESVRDRLPASLAGRVFWVADGDAAPIDGLRDLDGECAGMTAEDPPAGEDVRTQDAAFLIFTSGTTGMPKAAIMSHGRWLRAMAGVGMASLRMARSDVFYCPLPLYHNNAITLAWGATLSAGATLAIGRKFSASRFWDEVSAFQATAFCYIGELCRYLLEQPAHPLERSHGVRVVLGNGLRPELWQAFRERFGVPHINEFYGASECNLLFTNSFNVDASCGFCPLSYAVVAYDPDTEEPVRDSKGRLRQVRTGESGLLLSRVTRLSPFDGYTSEEEGERKLLRDGFRRGDCWFNTGDLVRAMGFRHVQFVDRLGDTFRWKGENVATTEVESVMNAHEQVHEAVVYGVEVPDAEGRAGMASLTLVDDRRPLDGRGLAEHLHARLPEYAVPLFLRVRDGHDSTTTFKYQKTALKREGFDPRTVPDPVYVLRDRQRGYEPMDAQLHDAFCAGAHGDQREAVNE
ncbi:long-chain-acyl-CoA synthetase [Aquisalimonas asiatica]|uniref:Fatty-acyl-CoA synthase n=1 Tax=Aquisalimonas asiatica TaxID=406100 RepID=A0A1H8TZT1_9GAMM|nr:long-chain-acyl-CoA synthetase [Aquisalimonas asiatica]SEO96520.1 fatty-acyl-CoA synthase [Aquisalimonas asiatica]